VCSRLVLDERIFAQAALKASQSVKEEGFTRIGSDAASWPVDVHLLREAILSLVRCGWHPTCILMYDEAWDLLSAASNLMFKCTSTATCSKGLLFNCRSQGDASMHTIGKVECCIKQVTLSLELVAPCI
jgi:hypothetical protein